MQKIVYEYNKPDETNKLLEEGWKVVHICNGSIQGQTYIYAVLEKDDEKIEQDQQ